MAGVTEPEGEAGAPPTAPAGVSGRARAYLDGARRNRILNGPRSYPDRDDREGWHRLIALNDAAIGERLAHGAKAERAVDVEDTEKGGVHVYVMRPEGVPVGAESPVYLEFHGGALIFGGGDLCRRMAIPAASGREMITWAVDYRMPPDHPYPAAVDDALAAYRSLLEDRPPEQIFVGGGSAGGNVAAALMVRVAEEGLPAPAALVLLTPEVDLTESGDTFTTLLGVDCVLDRLMPINLLYADGRDLADPHLSPLFADLSRFPPTFLQSGTRDLFLSNTIRMHRRLIDAGVEAELHVWEAMPHGGFGGAPEDAEVLRAVARFLEAHRRPPA